MAVEPGLVLTSPAEAPASAEPDVPRAPLADVPPLDARCVPLEGEIEETPPLREFSAHGYRGQVLRITRGAGEASAAHCIRVLWPKERWNADGKPSRVAERIDDAWFRAIENTLARVPWSHVRELWRVVIDNRPTEHGIAPFDRQSPDDGRDGHTLWLHEHLFVDRNHWAQGNFGSYWSYHVSDDTQAFDGQPSDHALFSPVLLHELGHLVMYNRINPASDRAGTPPCARTCGDAGNCAALPPSAREAGCVTPYCMPFRFQAGTENWAEQYRFYYQSSVTRAILTKAETSCATTLAAADADHGSPWDAGLPDIPGFRKSLWHGCGGRACKPF
jgi:hypothetical protein